MTRVARYRIGYFVLLALLAIGTYLAVRATGGSIGVLLVAVVVLLIPGRVQGLLLRPLFSGQRCLDRGQAAEAARQFEALIALLDRQPWRRWALWLGWSPYTPSALALAYNNLGVAHAQSAEFPLARAAWERALGIDALYPLPHANLAALAAHAGDAATAADLLAKSRRLGYTGGALDQATRRVQQLLAAFESRGPSA